MFPEPLVLEWWLIFVWFILYYVYECFACICVYENMHAWYSWRLKKDSWPPRIKITNSYEPQCECWEPKFGPLQEQWILLTSESSLQTLIVYLNFLIIFNFYLFSFVCAHSTVHRCFQRTLSGVSFFLLPCGLQESNSDYQAWQRALSCAEPSPKLYNSLTLTFN